MVTVTNLKPMNFWKSLLFFGIPAGLLVLSEYLLIPVFKNAGLSDYVSYSWSLLIFLVPLLVAALVAFRLEGHRLTWNALRERFRLRQMSGRDWLWTAGLFLFMCITYFGLIPVSRLLISDGIIPLPVSLPAMLDPRLPQTVEGMKILLGGQIQGQWGLVVLTLTLLLFNIISEEVWWRGYILPRQELVFGKYAWLIHGILWCLFHAFKYWDWLVLLPTCLGIAYVAQRQKNTWPGILTHLLLNGLSVLGILLLVITGGPH